MFFFVLGFRRRFFESVCQYKIEAQGEGPEFMLSLVETMSRGFRLCFFVFCYFRVWKSNKAQW
jgi:hypothetical protein